MQKYNHLENFYQNEVVTTNLVSIILGRNKLLPDNLPRWLWQDILKLNSTQIIKIFGYY